MAIPIPFDLPARHLQRFWGASGDFWQSQWDKFLDITGKFLFVNHIFIRKRLKFLIAQFCCNEIL